MNGIVFFANPSDPDMNRLHSKHILVFVTQLCAQNCHKSRQAGFYSEIIGHQVPCNSHAKSC